MSKSWSLLAMKPAEPFRSSRRGPDGVLERFMTLFRQSSLTSKYRIFI